MYGLGTRVTLPIDDRSISATSTNVGFTVEVPMQGLLGWKWTAVIHAEDVEAIVKDGKMAFFNSKMEFMLHEARVRRLMGCIAGCCTTKSPCVTRMERLSSMDRV
jgi:hypothetical protein